MSQFFESADGSRRNLRIALFAIILLTLPFYCIGFVLWSVAPQTPGASIGTPRPSLTPQTREPSATPGATLTLPPFVTPTGLSPLLPTPIQFNTPAGGGGITNPVFPPTSLPPTVFIPPPTIAPTLTFVPPPPTSTPLPPPTSTPIPPPSNTPVPPPTIEVPTSTTIPFPSDTPTATGEALTADIATAEAAP
jgi:hypothetical protein